MRDESVGIVTQSQIEQRLGAVTPSVRSASRVLGCSSRSLWCRWRTRLSSRRLLGLRDRVDVLRRGVVAGRVICDGDLLAGGIAQGSELPEVVVRSGDRGAVALDTVGLAGDVAALVVVKASRVFAGASCRGWVGDGRQRADRRAVASS